MMHSERSRKHHQPPPRLRLIAGWIAIVAGIAMLVLPGPGLLAIALGAVLLGRHNPTLRRWALVPRLMVRRLCRAEQGMVKKGGYWLRARHRLARLFVREQLHRHANGQPLSPVIQIWIGLTVMLALASLGISVIILVS